MGGIGGEVELATPRNLDGRRHPPPDEDGTAEDDDEQDWADEQLGEHEVGLGPADVRDVLAHHQVAARDVASRRCEPACR